MIHKAEVPILPIRNNMELKRGSSDLDTIITHNLSDTYPILMVGDCPSTFGRQNAS